MGDYRVNGFRAFAVAAGLRKTEGLDLALIVSDQAATSAGVFTTNRVKAAPVIITQQRVTRGSARAIVANAGNANACTGDQGVLDALRTTEFVAKGLGIAPEDVLVASTGVIGRPLNMDLFERAIPGLIQGLSQDGIPLAAQAIMTTDSFQKISLFEGLAQGQPYRILGMAKGAGMIMPNMATLLSFILTDIGMGDEDLRSALTGAVQKTFNRITVDGDTSTNDTVLVLANGMAGNRGLSNRDKEAFQKGLQAVMGDLCRMIVRDGEGATKLVTLRIRGAMTPHDALTAARVVANSPLVKTAFFGQDANWGRIMAALGRSEVSMEEKRVDIWVDDIQIVKGGLGKGAGAEARANERMKMKEFNLTIDLHQGEYADEMVTCDFSEDYIRINAGYRT